MKPTFTLLLALTILTSGCASPTSVPATPTRIEPDTATSTSVPPETDSTPENAIPTETAFPSKEIWLPPLASSFSWQLSEEVNTEFDAAIFDLDAFETETSLISRLHSEGKKAFCYISVGSWEDWRPDAETFPSEIIGKDYEGWKGEKWLDIRQIDQLAPIMRARLDMCAEKGFDGIEPDNMDLHWADTGFDISYEDQLAYNIWLAEEAHARGLSIGQKNAEDQTIDLLPYSDWGLTEDCFVGEWCEEMLPLIEVGKPVFSAEYTDEISYEEFIADICPKAETLGFYVFLKNRNLDEYRAECP
ncbi:MAG: endo alpha-1,4 polygalactosaminidase [Chloroflexi bacterium]|nr:MAG: endo alpha-1,4 polygalactosaminidase [Chloroflexota bacterium]